MNLELYLSLRFRSMKRKLHAPDPSTKTLADLSQSVDELRHTRESNAASEEARYFQGLVQHMQHRFSVVRPGETN